MSELSPLIEHWSHRRDEPFALATVVRVHGSAYRRPGARMLIDARGATLGLMSGGCLESDVAQHAVRVLKTGRSELVRYDTRLLFGCDGALEILVETLNNEFFKAAQHGLNERHTLLAATVFKSNESALPLGTQPILAADGQVFNDALPEDLLSQSRAALSEKSARPVGYSSGESEALLHSIEPPIQLYVFGSGPDIVPVCALAAQLNWRVTVVARAAPQVLALPFDCEIVFVAPEALAATIVADARTAAIVMTHNYGRDLAYLAQLLRLPLPYIGLLGARGRRERLLGDLAALDDALDLTNCDNLYSPAGLDIGAEGPHEIAFSMLSEVQQVLAGRAGGSLRDRQTSIHAE